MHVRCDSNGGDPCMLDATERDLHMLDAAGKMEMRQKTEIHICVRCDAKDGDPCALDATENC